jgi:acid phosphatase (class A)
MKTVTYIGALLLLGAIVYIFAKGSDVPTPQLTQPEHLTFSNTQTWNAEFKALSLKRPNVVSDVYEKITLPPPPPNSSTTTQAELATLHALRNETRDEKMDEIRAEVDLPATVFGSYIFSTLIDTKTHPHTSMLLLSALKEVDPVLFYFKHMFDRVRPHKLDSSLTTAIEVPDHPAYPSGHSTQSHLIALILSDLDPQNRDVYMESAFRVAHNREIAGLHYPSDSEAGKLLATQYYTLLKETEWYRTLLKNAQTEW